MRRCAQPELVSTSSYRISVGRAPNKDQAADCGRGHTKAALRHGATAVVRKNSVTCRPARGNIRDAARQGSVWLGRHTTLRGDSANLEPDARGYRRADREHQDPAPCAGARCCNGESTISEWIVVAMRIAESANPGTRDESCR